MDLDEQLKDIFKNGLRVSFVTYPDNHCRRTRAAWNIGKHDEESNTVRWSSPGQKISIAADYYGHLGNWQQTMSELMRRFSFSASKVRRWVRAAQGMDEKFEQSCARRFTPASKHTPSGTMII